MQEGVLRPVEGAEKPNVIFQYLLALRKEIFMKKQMMFTSVR